MFLNVLFLSLIYFCFVLIIPLFAAALFRRYSISRKRADVKRYEVLRGVLSKGGSPPLVFIPPFDTIHLSRP